MPLIHVTEPITAVERQELIANYIMPDPYHPGIAHYCLRESAVSVWALVAYYEAVGYDLDCVASDYDVPEKHIRAAFAFYAEYTEDIDVYLLSRIEAVSDA